MNIQQRLLCFLFLILSIPAWAQERPKLVVGIVVDQMRYDYLYRYYDKYSENGLKKLMTEGFNCRNNHYNYIPTYTGPGHASIYTGTSPAINGIAGNDWYDRYKDDMMYCAEDKTVSSVGSDSDAGQMSPRNLLASTITDQLRLASNKRSKVVGVSLKDRGSILPAGHMPTAAYWFDSSNGAFISSTYYMNELPGWVKKFNSRDLAKKYLSQKWKTLLPIDEYIESTADDKPYENTLSGEEKPVFPHKLKYSDTDYGIIRSTPFGNSISKDFAIAAIEGEDMGEDEITDFLALSFSSTDYVGHGFGPYSVEAQDTYLRLDRDIAELLEYLDKRIGKENVLVFLTADHGAADVPAFSQEEGIPAGVLNSKETFDALKNYLKEKLGDEDWVLHIANYQIYLDRELLAEKEISINEVFRLTRDFLLSKEGIYNVVNLQDLSTANVPSNYLDLIRNGYNPKRSGDLLVLLEPNWFQGSRKGTTHGSMFAYDTHIPLLWYGFNVPAGETTRKTHITDIAPTIAQLLYILEPNGTIGEPIGEVTGR
ncbi:type I phosphodiesterase/nucleotide pyrophosphatase [Anseongella ginsenosidimutans]|uniref:Type I phosphodiesterase/nucleotide pyrophosphatase n=1 Tax=Anseongella ginsenosidimutans TaxID=496056 RepID=A0A4R3KU95_9SPHI|nr:alkaline phosphatase PafA [Anseongella ginsenosidimutans]QEC53341.1 alkaline phosphatase family protein [Anseongella ginsenosidimutans]TCS88225.1 type I phosphodiesterase/nucleotide pyrophosphatase [Anseongella ginsenosidimutans]